MASALLSASLLLASSKPDQRQSDLPAVLFSRLKAYSEATKIRLSVNANSSLVDLQIETANHALTIIEDCQHTLIDVPDTTYGTKDLTKLQTLLSLVFNWGSNQLFTIASSYWQSPPIDIDEVLEFIKHAAVFSQRVLSLCVPDENQEVPQTLITNLLFSRHPADLLKIGLLLGWSPGGSLSQDTSPSFFQSCTTKILSILPPAEAISALGKLLSLKLPKHAHEPCTKFMSRQLMRPKGIDGLLEAMFGGPNDGNSDVPTLPKLQQIARVINAVPSDLAPQHYYETVIPRVFSLISASSPAIYRTAGAFTISRMLTSKSRQRRVAISLINSYLHEPWSQITKPLELEEERDKRARTSEKWSLQSPQDALLTLTLLLANIDPSPSLVASILSPIIPPLYCLHEWLAGVKTVDPGTKENLSAVLSTWGRVVSMEDAKIIIWKIVQGEGGFWQIDIAGDIQRTEERRIDKRLAMLTPEDIKRAAESEDDMDSNFLDLKPDPAHFVKFLSSLQNTDLSVWLLIRLLQEYRQARASPESDPLVSLVYLQILVRLQTSLVDQKMTIKVLKQPQQIVSFVKEVVDSSGVGSIDNKESRESNTPRNPLRFVNHGDQESESETFEETQGVEDEILITALNLLLSIFEANKDLSARTFLQLNDVFASLEPLTQHSSNSIAQLARECRLVMTARLASSSNSNAQSVTGSVEEDQRETYHKALRLLQDPILPVRAHGLMLLRQLVLSSQKNKVDDALIPAILSIFLQAVQDDDPYIFLNAIQGLSAMVDEYGGRLLSELVTDYSGKLDGLGSFNLTQRDLDTRLRIGEALTQVIRRYGEALGIYVDILVPPIAALIRNASVPTALRTSAISILSQAIDTHVTSLLQYTPDLFEAMVDLIQVETVSASGKAVQDRSTSSEEDRIPPDTIDTKPTSNNPKFPLLRRAALNFLSSLIVAATHQVYRVPGSDILPLWILQRAQTTLAYVAATDADSMVQVMAREGLEQLEQFDRARVDL